MSSPGNRTYYARFYDTAQDRTHNDTGQQGRARSGSMGQLDQYGNRSNRLHFHAIKNQTTLVTQREDAPPHSVADWAHVQTSSRPMTIPGAVQSGVEMGTKRKY